MKGRFWPPAANFDNSCLRASYLDVSAVPSVPCALNDAIVRLTQSSAARLASTCTTGIATKKRVADVRPFAGLPLAAKRKLDDNASPFLRCTAIAQWTARQ